MYEVPPGVFEPAGAGSFRTLFGDFVKRRFSPGYRNGLLRTFVAFDTVTMSRCILISKGAELVRVPVEHLVFIQAEGNYSHLVTRDGRRTLISYQLGQIEDIIEDQLGDTGGQFLRIGRGLIVNSVFIYQIDITSQRLVLSDCNGCCHELSASKEVLTKLKVWMESELNSVQK